MTDRSYPSVIEGRPGLVNAPTVFNSGYNFKTVLGRAGPTPSKSRLTARYRVASRWKASGPMS